MRRFLIEMAVSVVFLSIGFSLCFFELSDYDYVEYQEVMDKTVLDIEVDGHHDIDGNHALRLDVDDDIRVHFNYTENDDEHIRIEFSSLLNYKKNDNHLRINDLSWSSWSTWKKYYTVFIDGLKDHKLTTFHEHYEDDEIESVTITCSKKVKELIDIRYR